MKADLYNERTARVHYKRFKEILYSPSILNLSNDITDSLSAAINSVTKTKDAEPTSAETKDAEIKDVETDKSEVSKTDTEPTVPKQDESKASEETKVHTPQEEHKNGAIVEEKKKSQEEEYTKMMKDIKESMEEAKKNITPLNLDSQSLKLSEAFNSPLNPDISSFAPVKCLEFMGFSSFNPAPSSLEMKGDLFYLKVKTLEGQEFVITSNVKGFYINNSHENVSFDPSTCQRNNPCNSHSLVGLMCQLSPKFSDKLEEHINNILKTDPFCMSSSQQPTQEWLTQENSAKYNTESFKFGNEDAISGYYGLDSKGSRDWNEEFQVCKDLPKENIFQRIQRDRAFYKIYYDFIDSSKKGAIAIVNRSIPALNPMDEEYQHVFVYNQIFFSYAVDNKDHYKDVSSNDSNPTFTATNHDMLGLRTLQVLDMDGLHIIATCHINYKGYRVIAQSIIPGILTNSDQSSLTEFGSVDDGKTIHNSDVFNELMKKLCEQLSIKQCPIVDDEGKSHLIYGSIDVKGIQGTDKRKYLLDLVRLTPRDSNYLGKNYSSCLVRHELVRIYQKSKDIEFAIKKSEVKEKCEK
jgi:protein TIF31